MTWQNTVIEGPTMHQEFETSSDMLRECMRVVGGSKRAGSLLFPDKQPPERAASHLLACLDEHRAERLTFDQTLLLIEAAQARGFRGGMQFICDRLKFTVGQPITPADEIAEWQRVLCQHTEQARHIADKLQSAADRLFNATQQAHGPQSSVQPLRRTA